MEITNNKDPIIIGITGRSRSGKSKLAKKLAKDLHHRFGETSLHIDMDYFFIWASEFTCENSTKQESLAIKELCNGLSKLKSGSSASFSIFDCRKKNNSDRHKKYNSEKFIIIEGILVLWDKDIRDLIDLKVFIDTSNEICRERRLRKALGTKQKGSGEYEDVKVRERNRWEEIISPQWDLHLDSTRKYADIITSNLKDSTEEILTRLSCF